MPIGRCCKIPSTNIVCLVFQVLLSALAAGRAFGQGVSGPVENPAALLNLARLDADAGRLDGAISNYERLLAIIDTPLSPGPNGATAAQWKALAPVAKLNLGLLYAAKGIDFFQVDDLDDAISSFRTSLEWNPYSRDIRYNLCQAMYIWAGRLKDQGRPAGELTSLYADIVKEATRVRDADPGNLNLRLILAYSHRYAGDENSAAPAFAENANFPFEVNDVRMDIGGTGTRLSGVVKNLKLTQGDPVRLRITLIALNGTATASSDVEVSAPPINQGTTFAVSLKTAPGESDVAGWRYEVLNSPPVKPR
jgi:tetratricopeptide (TPR) repeat protein